MRKGRTRVPSRVPWLAVRIRSLFLLLLLALPARGADLVSVESEDVAAVTEFLALREGEAALLVFAAAGLDRLSIDGLDVPLSGPAPWAVRDLRDGFARVVVQRADRRWEGSVRAVAALVVPWDATEALASTQAVSRDLPSPLDTFAFYEELDRTYDPVKREAVCSAWQIRARDGVERRVVLRACAAPAPLGPAVRAAQAEVVELDAELDEDLAPAVSAGERLEHDLLYDGRGRLRKDPRGTPIRVILFGVGAAATGVFTALSLHWEVQAETSWADALVSERFGDDAGWTVGLLRSRDMDQRRDASIAAGLACLTGTVTSVLIQEAEGRRLRRLRARGRLSL